MANFRGALILLFSSFALAQNQSDACVLKTAQSGDVITVRGEALQQPHDLAFAIDGCHDLVLLAYAGDQDSEVGADQLHRDENLKRFRKYTTATYASHGKKVCLECMKYDNVKATVTGRFR